MIVVENIEINNKTYKKSFSDNGFKIRKSGTNEIYDIAIDVLDFEYEETDEKVEENLEQVDKPKEIEVKVEE